MKKRIESFLADVDQTLTPHAAGGVLELYHLGRSALVWEYDYVATTQDFDFLRPDGAAALVDLALKTFGRGTAKARAHGLYLEVVEPGLPPMPFGYKRRARAAGGPWRTLRVYRLEPHDLIVSKLRRFSAKDRADIRMLCDRVRIGPDRLQEALEEAYPFSMEKDGDEFRDAAFRHLHVVQQYLRHEISEF